MPGMTYDKERVSVNVARLKKGSETFEVVIDSDNAVRYKKDEIKDIRDAIKDDKIFSDARKGLLSSEKVMKGSFKTSDPLEVAKVIIKEGKIQLSAEYRERMREEKKKRIISIISRNGVDPRTHTPHPAARIENAFEEAKVRIDDYKSADDQVQDILRQLRPILPIRFEMKEMAVKISAEYAGKCYSAVKGFGKILRENWLSDGSWDVVVEIPGGLEEEIHSRLNSITHGNVETKVLKIR